MMQREVADRLAAIPGTRDYGLLTATTQMHARVENLFTLAPESFSPPPDVYSTVLRLDFAPRFSELDVAPAAFDTFLRTCFAQKRKTLANNLRAAGHAAASLQSLWAADIPAQARAESLSLESLAAMHRALRSTGVQEPQVQEPPQEPAAEKVEVPSEAQEEAKAHSAASGEEA